MKTRKITIELTETACQLLGCLDDERTVENVLSRLADHAQQGVYRPGAWERQWICQVFGTEFVERLTPGDPYGRKDCESIFQRPRTARDEAEQRRALKKNVKTALDGLQRHLIDGGRSPIA